MEDCYIYRINIATLAYYIKHLQTQCNAPLYLLFYPRPQYTDVRMFDASWSGGSSYVYYTRPYEICYNPDLRWQRNRNAEVGVDMNFGGTRISLAAYFNRTKNPYTTETEYLPAAFNKYGLPEGYAMPANPLLKVDSQT
ncbi:TonB-dependent receptor domain-containing protein, partial [Helicobacter typhlonius]|uniref:TonB-dependent receptor domain-containing protein n=1 Tax=Helicobacter typhlonius TaxID=76936 RepID=UPI002FE3254B